MTDKLSLKIELGKNQSKKYQIDSGLGGVFTVKLIEPYGDNRYVVEIDNPQSDFHGKRLTPLITDIREVE